MVKASVIIAVHNGAHSIQKTIHSILMSLEGLIEVIAVNDASDDSTQSVLNEFSDPRLRILQTHRRMGPAHSRNLGIQEAQGPILFFTDADCEVEPNWISEGLASLASPEILGVEGRIRYGEDNPTLRHRLPIQMFCLRNDTAHLWAAGSQFCTGNVAYRTDAVRRLNGFNENRYQNGREDSDLGWRIRSLGATAYNDKMIVTHHAQLWDWASLAENARRYAKDVYFYKDHQSFFYQLGPILHPKYLAMLIFPPLLLLNTRLTRPADFLFLPQFYGYLLKLRLEIWKAALSERILAL